MIVDNSNGWSFRTNDVEHFWTTGCDYEFAVDEDAGTVTFGSDTADATEITLTLAQDFANMFSDLFGVDLTQYSTSDEAASDEDTETASTED